MEEPLPSSAGIERSGLERMWRSSYHPSFLDLLTLADLKK
jgi:hypothetical protein